MESRCLHPATNDNRAQIYLTSGVCRKKAFLCDPLCRLCASEITQKQSTTETQRLQRTTEFVFPTDSFSQVPQTRPAVRRPADLICRSLFGKGQRDAEPKSNSGGHAGFPTRVEKARPLSPEAAPPTQGASRYPSYYWRLGSPSCAELPRAPASC